MKSKIIEFRSWQWIEIVKNVILLLLLGIYPLPGR